MQPNKQVEFKDSAREKIATGVNLVADAVKITLGPRGRNVLIQRIGQPPMITNDGVSIANAIKVEDQFVNSGVEMAKEVARRTDRIAGDGTTTTLILYQALIQEGLKHLQSNVNVMALKKGMDLAKDELVSRLKVMAEKVVSLEDIKKVAYISVENDKLAEMIANILYKVGVNGNVIVEESDIPDIRVDDRDGYIIDRGYASPYVINNPAKAQGEYTNVKVLVTDKKLMTSESLIHLFQKMQAQGTTNLLVVADDIDGEMLVSSQISHTEGLFNVIPVRFASYSADRAEILKDIAVKCGTEVYGHGRKKDLKDLEVDDLGTVEKVIIKKDQTFLIGGGHNKVDFEELVESLKTRIEEETNDSTKQYLISRYANLQNITVVIRVGGLTEQERKYYKLKIDDAVNATRGAMEEGIVEGGGYTLAMIASDFPVSKHDKDVASGIKIVLSACNEPFRRLLENCGESTESFGLERYNASTGKFVENLFDEGVVDPVKVTINALSNAISGASLFLTTECAVVFDKEFKLEQ